MGTKGLTENMRNVENFSYRHVMTKQQLQDNTVKVVKLCFILQ